MQEAPGAIALSNMAAAVAASIYSTWGLRIRGTNL